MENGAKHHERTAERPHYWTIALSIASVLISLLALVLQQRDSAETRRLTIQGQRFTEQIQSLNQRAWVELLSVAAVPFTPKNEEGIFAFDMQIHNRGNSSALDVKMIQYVREEKEGAFKLVGNKQEESFGTVSPGQLIKPERLSGSIDRDTIQVTFHGTITYRDSVGSHHTNWCYVLDIGRTANLRACETGNDIN